MAKRSKRKYEQEVIASFPLKGANYLKNGLPHVPEPPSIIKYLDSEHHGKSEFATVFTRIYSQFYAYAFFIAKSFVPTEDARDIVASVFSKLWLKGEDLMTVQPVKSYIGSCVRNACKDHLRKESYTRKKENEYLSIHPDATENDWLEGNIHAEKLQMIYSELEKLPPRCKEIFRLAYIRNLKNAEIADLLGITNNTVRNQKSYALKTLKMALLTVPILILLSVFS